MEVLYHVRPYFVGIFPYIGLMQALYMVGTSNQSVPQMASAIMSKAVDFLSIPLMLGPILISSFRGCHSCTILWLSPEALNHSCSRSKAAR